MSALVVRLAYLAWRGPSALPDTTEYFTLARNIVEHGVLSLETSAPYASSIRRAPLYPTFLALLEWLGLRSPAAVASIQAALDAAVAVAVLMLARRLVSSKWAKIVALTYALHPGAVVSSTSLLSESLSTDFLVGSAFALVVGLERTRLWLVAIAGFSMGLAILCRPTVLLLPVLLVLVFQLAREVRGPRVVAAIFLTAMGSLLCPWIVRSSILAGRFVPVQAYGAVNFYVATRTDWDWRDEAAWWPRVWEDLGMRAAKSPQAMADLDRWFMREAGRNILAEPGKYLASRAKALPYLLLTSFDKFTGINESFGVVLARAELGRLLVKLSLLVLFSLLPVSMAIVGLADSMSRAPAWISAVFWMYILVVHVPQYFENRYLWPAMPFLLQSAAIGAERVGCLLQRKGARMRGEAPGG